MVVTSRFRWVASLALAMASLGILLAYEPVALVGMMMVFWLGAEWTFFRFQALFGGAPLTHVHRVIERLPTGHRSLNIDHPYQVSVEGQFAKWCRGKRLWVVDVAPFHCLEEVEETRDVFDVNRGSRFGLSYRLMPRVVGKMSIPGLQVLVTDRRGLFRRQYFVPIAQELTVLPFVARPEATHSVLKRNNIQILNGNHRYRRPGFSPELLGIRDYQSGDPPRTIAWKATARLGKLMTCEYENEVPIRSTLIYDFSEYQFVGRPGPAVADRVVSAAASISRLLLSDRDPVGCHMVAADEKIHLRHGYGERQLTRIVQAMLAYCERQQVTAEVEMDSLVRHLWVGAYRRFPELFDDLINRPRIRIFPLSQPAHLTVTQREQVAFVLVAIYQAKPGLVERLMHSDREFRRYARRYMADFPLRQTKVKRLLDANRQRRAEQAAINQISRAIMEGVTRAKDNELFVIFSITPMEESEQKQLEQAVRFAAAAHHRVIMIDVGKQVPMAAFLDLRASHILAKSRDRGLAEQQQRLRRSLTQLGARVASLDEPQLISTVAQEVELLRSGRTRTIPR